MTWGHKSEFQPTALPGKLASLTPQMSIRGFTLVALGVLLLKVPFVLILNQTSCSIRLPHFCLSKLVLTNKPWSQPTFSIALHA